MTGNGAHRLPHALDQRLLVAHEVVRRHDENARFRVLVQDVQCRQHDTVRRTPIARLHDQVAFRQHALERMPPLTVTLSDDADDVLLIRDREGPVQCLFEECLSAAQRTELFWNRDAARIGGQRLQAATVSGRQHNHPICP